MGFFDNLFSKKKKDDKGQDKKVEVDEQKTKDVSKVKDEKKPKKKSQPKEVKAPRAQQEPSEDDWIYELVLQYLNSPPWKLTISEFLDEHCIIFDDEEENKFSYYDLHKKFKKMMESLVDGMVEEIGITEEQFGTVIEKGLKSQSHKKYFEQLLIIDNFLVFKKLMIKRNKSNELEALKELQVQEAHKARQNGGVAGPGSHTKQIKKLELEKEKAELEHALAMSQAVEDERKKMMQDEESEFMEAIKQSEIEYKQQQQLKPKHDEEQKQEVVIEEEQVVAFEEDFTQNQQQPSMSQFYGAPEVKEATPPKKKKQSKLEPIDKQEISQINSFPAQKSQVVQNFVFESDKSTILSQDRSQIQAQIELIKQQQVEIQQNEDPAEQVESSEDRKKRLLEQRDLIRKKKQAEREKELENYQKSQMQQPEQKQDQQSDFIDQQKKATTDLQRRKELLEQKKKQLLMNKIKEDVSHDQDLL